MATIQKPYALSWNGITLDSSEINTLNWNVSGAISVAFSITILKNSDNSTVWTLPKTISYATKYDIPSNSILNGDTYKVSVTIWDSLNNQASSDYVVFQAYSRPIVSISPIGTISSPNITITATYSQSQSIPIRSWIAYLFDSNQNEIKNSGIQTSSILEYLFTDLLSEKTYYVEFKCTSNVGLVATSGKIEFSVLFTTPTFETILTAENIENAGIRLSMEVIKITGTSNPSPATYLNNSEVDLTTIGNWVEFSEGFKIYGTDFTLKLWLKNVHVTTDTSINDNDYILLLTGNYGWKIFLQYRLDNRFHLFKKVGTSYSHYISQPVLGESFFVGIQQIQNTFNIMTQALESTELFFIQQNLAIK